MECPNCGSRNPGPGPFCMGCGYRLPPATASTPARAESELRAPLSTAAAAWPAAAPAPMTPAGQTAGEAVAQASNYGAYWQRPEGIGQMQSAGTVPVSIWGPFAGYGTRGRHVSWLINDQGDRADALRDVVTARFDRREIPNAAVQRVTLVRQGVLVDSRPYFLVRRGLATAGLYIARFGRDLYTSQVTYYKGPISSLRVILVIVMGVFAFGYPAMYSNAFDSVGYSLLGGVQGLGNLLGVFCCLGPLYLLDLLGLSLLALYSGYKWLAEKDFLAALRVPPNEFDTDDIVALEKSVEQTVRESLDEVGIEQRLMPEASEYGMRRRLI